MNASIKLYNYNFTTFKTYYFALLFVIGNMALPQLAHLIPNGGFMLLPIYFFTLVGAYKYGFWVGLLTALLSPILNHLLFAMPPLTVLPALLTKSVVLAAAASYIAHKNKTVTILNLLLAVAVYQLVGSAIEWLLVGNFFVATQDLRIGIPGMLLQVFGGYALLKASANA
ncbi:MAG: ECF transporter S component [Porphyromonadaceae bacterium CG2_30_38_12]|nr:MAG: ECF transporter S component [Porphyromonadaceae bacterium CG2_30_38_12]